MSNFGTGSNSNGQFWYGSTTNFPGFLYKKNIGVGARRSTKFSPGGNTTCNTYQYLYNTYVHALIHHHASNASGVGLLLSGM